MFLFRSQIIYIAFTFSLNDYIYTFFCYAHFVQGFNRKHFIEHFPGVSWQKVLNVKNPNQMHLLPCIYFKDCSPSHIYSSFLYYNIHIVDYK